MSFERSTRGKKQKETFHVFGGLEGSVCDARGQGLSLGGKVEKLVSEPKKLRMPLS